MTLVIKTSLLAGRIRMGLSRMTHAILFYRNFLIYSYFGILKLSIKHLISNLIGAKHEN